MVGEAIFPIVMFVIMQFLVLAIIILAGRRNRRLGLIFGAVYSLLLAGGAALTVAINIGMLVEDSAYSLSRSLLAFLVTMGIASACLLTLAVFLYLRMLRELKRMP